MIFIDGDLFEYNYVFIHRQVVLVLVRNVAHGAQHA